MEIKNSIRRGIIWIGIIGAIQFLIFTSSAMIFYPGGTIHDRSTEGYSFLTNYFSDLGRTRAWNGEDNSRSSSLFQSSLVIGGISLSLFFLVLPGIFSDMNARFTGSLAAITGVIAALCYLGIAFNPLDVDYWGHSRYVRAGFITFLLMSFFYTLAILNEPAYPNRYARAFGIFSIILFIQIVIMLFGPRARSSPDALFLQATAQKIVVYSEIICMLYQCTGALKALSSMQEQGKEQVG